MLKIEHVSKYFGEKLVVDDLSMQLEAGQVMGLIGQNGAGKTTSFRMILKFIDADKGVITWNGKAITQKVKQMIGFLPEERGLYQKMTVEDQIVYFAELHGMKRADARARLKDWFDRLEIVGKISDKVQSLSKGNAQKVQFIATFIHEPRFLILDEPFTGLDPVNTEMLRNEIKRARDNGAAVIFSNHNMSDVERLSDNLTMLKAGKTVLQGGLQEIRESYGRTRVFINSPVTDEEIKEIKGVLAIKHENDGRLVKVAEEEVGHQIFQKVSASGYVPAFMQTPPTLDEIFRMEVAENEEVEAHV